MDSIKLLALYVLSFSQYCFISFNVSANEARCNRLNILLDSVITGTSQYNNDYIEGLCNQFIDLDCNNKILAYNLLGYIKYNNSELSEAKTLLLKGEENYIEEKSPKKYYSLNQNYLALVEIIEKDFESALIHLNKSKAIAESINDIVLIEFASLNLGLIYLETGKLDLAEKHLNETLKIRTKIDESRGFVYQNLARIYAKQNRADEALEMAEASKNIWQQLNDKKGLYFVALLKAEIFRSVKEYDTALEVLIEGRRIGELAGIKLLMGETYRLEAHIHQLKNNTPDEIVALKQVLNFHNDLSFEAIEASTLRLCELSENTNNADVVNALLGIIANSTKQNKENAKRQITKEVRLEKEIESITAKTKKQLAAIGGLFGFLIIIAAFLLRIFKQNKVVKLLNEELLNSKQKIELQMDELELRNEELKNFAYVASHDLKSPLKTIGSFTNLIELKLNGQADKVKPYLNYVKKATDNMSGMISDLLTHATTENQLNLKPISFNKIIYAALDNLKIDIKKNKAIINIKNTGGDTIFCDEIKMITVMQNLISNAINYAKPNQNAKIEISTQRSIDFFILKIKDNGIGIDPKYQSKIFEMFNRLKEKKGVDGSGIGLATCLKMVQMHNGDIKVNSTPNKGTQFIVQLPIKVSETVQ